MLERQFAIYAGLIIAFVIHIDVWHTYRSLVVANKTTTISHRGHLYTIRTCRRRFT